MAINLPDKYPGRANPASVDYPQGSFKNQTAPGAKDGTPLEEAWANDKEGFFQSLISEAGLTPSGVPDKVGASQYLSALKSITSGASTETVAGVIRTATQPEVDAGTAGDIAVSPSKMRAGFTSSFGASGYIFLPTWMGGYGFQWGAVDAGPAPGEQTITFPTAFPVACYGVVSTFKFATDIGSFNGSYLTVNPLLNNSARFLATVGRYWMAWGK